MQDNVVEANHIHDSMMLLADGGAIYTLGFMPGMSSGNHIHDVHRSKFAGSAPNNGMFFDQGSKVLVERNVIYRTWGIRSGTTRTARTGTRGWTTASA